MNYIEDKLYGKIIDFKKGKTYYILLKSSDKYKIHILENIEGMIVYKYYGKHNQWWHYKIEHPYSLTGKIKKYIIFDAPVETTIISLR